MAMVAGRPLQRAELGETVIVLLWILGLLLSGLIVGALGGLVIPGPNPMSIGMTMVVGIGGSLLGGLVGALLLGRPADCSWRWRALRSAPASRVGLITAVSTAATWPSPRCSSGLTTYPAVNLVGDESAAGGVNGPVVEPRVGSIERRLELATATGRRDCASPVLSILGSKSSIRGR